MDADLASFLPLHVTEGTDFVSEVGFPVALDPIDRGTRTLRFDIDTSFDRTDVGSAGDVLLVYLVDPHDPSQTLLEQSDPGAALLEISERGFAYAPSFVTFDGTTVQVDVSSVTGWETGLLLTQLVNRDQDVGSQFTLSNFENVMDPEGASSPRFSRSNAFQLPGPALDLTQFSESADVEFQFSGGILDTLTGRYVVDVSLINSGTSTISRNGAIRFPGLPAGVTLSNASGVDALGVPYINLSEVIGSGGLPSGVRSAPTRIAFDNLALVRIPLAPQWVGAGANRGPIIEPIPAITVYPGQHWQGMLLATDADGDAVQFRIRTPQGIPTGRLTANGELQLSPTPNDLGTYVVEIIASDGSDEVSTQLTITVAPDPDLTTRLSGVVLSTLEQPLAGIPIEFGADTTVTQADGSFELSLTTAVTSDTPLVIRGEILAGGAAYPYIAERLPLLLGHAGYEGINNVVERPIYLPALDLANGRTIDPNVDVTVTTTAIPEASVLVRAGTLTDQQGEPFEGVLSITEVPAERTPAALPSGMFPDLVVTIQPGEMDFQTPAPLSLPNLSGFLPGTELDLWSINPASGEFEIVGKGRVTADGVRVETIEGGIRSSSWHFFNLFGPTPGSAANDPRNQDKNCDDDCEDRDSPNDDAPPKSGTDGGDPGSHDPDPTNGTGAGSSGPPGADETPTPEPDASPENEPMGRRIHSDAGNDLGATPGDSSSPRSPRLGPAPGPSGPGLTLNSDFFSYENIFGRRQPQVNPNWPPGGNQVGSHVAPMTSASQPFPNTEVALHSGAVYKTHALVPYLSLGEWRGVLLRYDSERADPRPIVHTGFSDVGNSLPELHLISKLSIQQGNLLVEVPGVASGISSRLPGGEHLLRVPDGATTVDVSLQADLRSFPSGLYAYESTNRFANASANWGGTSASVSRDRLTHVNTINSPFGAGWGIDGLLEIVEDPSGAVLLINGSGGETLFEPANTPETGYVSPPGDFSRLEKLPDGRFQRIHPNQTVEVFDSAHRLASTRDRNGNIMRWEYGGSGELLRMIDPVGLITEFRHADGHIVEIEDPAGRVTKLSYSNGNLVQITDPDGTSCRFEYDTNHHLTAEINKRGNRESIVYDFAGRATGIVRTDGSLVQYAPVQTQGLFPPAQTSNTTLLQLAPIHGNRALAQHVDANGNVTETELDKLGQRKQNSDSEGTLPKTVRNDQNLPSQVIDGRGNVSLFEYDELGNLISVSDPVSRGTAVSPLYSGAFYAVGNNPAQVLTVDLNGDSFPDAVTANYFADSVSVLAGTGTTRFDFRTDYHVSNVRSVAAGDIDGDTLPDLVAASRDGHIAVLLANKAGTFDAAVTFPAGTNPNFVQLADLDQDGLLDAVVSDLATDSVLVLRGDGMGGFAAPQSFATGDEPASLVIADLDSNGRLDIATANRSSRNVTVLLQDGAGNFMSSNLPAVADGVDSIGVADFNGDGFRDLVVTGGSVRFHVMLGDGTGGFLPAVSVSLVHASGTSSSIPFNSKLAIFDANGDGDFDIGITEGPDAVSIFANDGTANFSLQMSLSIFAGTVSLAASDINIDGIADLVVLGNSDASIQALFGKGDGGFVAPPVSIEDVAVGARPIALDVADFNEDGHLDVVTANQNGNSVTIMLGDGTGRLERFADFPAGAVTLHAAAGDVDGDGHVDLVTSNYSSDQLSILTGDGTGMFVAAGIISVGAGPVEIVLADLDGDHDLDIVTAGNRNSLSQFSIVRNRGDGTFEPALITTSNFGATTVDVGDLNGDAIPDIAIGNAATSFSNRVEVRMGIGDGTFGPSTIFGFGGTGFFPGAPTQLRLMDATGDGPLDIVGTDPSTNSVRVRRGVGDGSFAGVEVYAVGTSPSSVDVGLIDGDLIPDLIVANQGSSSVTVLLGNGDGTFGTRTDFQVAAGVSWVRLVNLQETDGQSESDELRAAGGLDFVTTNRDANSLTARINTGEFAAHSQWTAEYDTTFSQLVRVVDEEGRQVLHELDPDNGNRLTTIQVVGSLGGDDDVVTRYTYTPQGQLASITDPLGRVMTNGYDSLGRMVRTTWAVGTNIEAVQEFAYDLAGNMSLSTDELGHRTEYRYDALNRLIEETLPDPDGAGPAQAPQSRFVYDDHGNLIESIDALQRTERFAYDAQHRVVEAIDAVGASLLFTYDQVGNQISLVDRLGRETKFEYDGRNRLVATIDALGGRSRKFYDADNNVIRTVDENNLPTSFALDSRDRIIRYTNPAGGTVQLEFDAVNNLIASTDELNRRVEMTYDELNREVLTRLPDPDRDGPDVAPTIRREYDLASNLIRVIDALANVTQYEYDERNRMVLQRDADPDGPGPLESPVTTIALDDANRIVSVTDPLGRVTRFEYDDLNRPVSVYSPDPDGDGPAMAPHLQYVFDAEGRQTSLIDPLGNVTHFDYDELDRVVRITAHDPDDAGPAISPVTEFVFDSEGELLQTVDPLGRTTTFEYDPLGRIIRQVLPDPDQDGPELAPVMQYQYDAAGNQIAMVDALGNSTDYEYDELYRVVKVVGSDPDGNGPALRPVTSYAYDAGHQLRSLTDSLGRTSLFAYDDLGRVVTETYPDPDGPLGPATSPVMRHTFDSMNNEIAMTDALGNVTNYEYDGLYRPTAVIQADPDGAGPQSRPIVRFGYDIASQPTHVTDPLGRTTEAVFDDLGRVVQRIYPDPDGAGPLTSPITEYTYDLIGNMLSMIDPVGNVTQYQYDDLYRQTVRMDADPDGGGGLTAPVTSYQYDSANQRVSVRDPLGRTTTYVYDDLGRVVQIQEPDPDGHGPLASPVTNYVYDAMNNQLAVIDPLGHTTRFEYDHLYRKVQQIDEDLDGTGPQGNPTTRFTYDLQGNLLSLSDPLGNVTSYQYDQLDRKISETILLGTRRAHRRQFSWDAMGNRIQSVDRNGRVIEYTYDALYRHVAERWLGAEGEVVQTLEFEYDEANQLLRGEDLATGSRYTYSYDDLGRIVQANTENGGPEVEFAQAYDAASRRTATAAFIDGQSDYLNQFTYDALHRLVVLTQTDALGNAGVATKHFDFTYNAASQVVNVGRFRSPSGLPSDLIADTSYTYDGIGRLTGMQHATTSGSLVDYEWTFDAASRIVTFDNSIDGLSEYGFDKGNQLTSATHSGQNDEAYSYDENGNRTLAGYTTGPHNRLLSDEVYQYTYDEEGNRITRTDLGTGELVRYLWDHRNRLVAVTTSPMPDELPSHFVSYRYDVYNRWISKLVDPDGDGPAGASVTRYHYDGDQIVLEFAGTAGAELLTHRYSWGPAVDQVLADEQLGGEVLYPLADRIGTVRDVVSADGIPMNHVLYDAFGNVVAESNSAVDLLFGFTGRAFDTATGLQNNRHRWLDNRIGRWLSEDPIGFDGADSNLLRYVNNDPTNSVDPTGLKANVDLERLLVLAKLEDASYGDPTKVRGTVVAGHFAKQTGNTLLGYRDVKWINLETGQAVLAIAGTNGVLDWVTNIRQSIGRPTLQYAHATYRADQLRREHGPNAIVIGHSLGGALAQVGALANGLKAVVFNAAGVHAWTLRRAGVGRDVDPTQSITDIKMFGDPLTTLQDGPGYGWAMPNSLVPSLMLPQLDVPTSLLGSWFGLKPIKRGHSMKTMISNIEMLIAYCKLLEERERRSSSGNAGGGGSSGGVPGSPGGIGNSGVRSPNDC